MTWTPGSHTGDRFQKSAAGWEYGPGLRVVRGLAVDLDTFAHEPSVHGHPRGMSHIATATTLVRAYLPQTIAAMHLFSIGEHANAGNTYMCLRFARYL